MLLCPMEAFCKGSLWRTFVGEDKSVSLKQSKIIYAKKLTVLIQDQEDLQSKKTVYSLR